MHFGEIVDEVFGARCTTTLVETPVRAKQCTPRLLGKCVLTIFVVYPRDRCLPLRALPPHTSHLTRNPSLSSFYFASYCVMLWPGYPIYSSQLFAIRSEASVLRMLEGSPDDFIHQPILKYLGERGVKHSTSRRITDITCESREKEGKHAFHPFSTLAVVGYPQLLLLPLSIVT